MIQRPRCACNFGLDVALGRRNIHRNISSERTTPKRVSITMDGKRRPQIQAQTTPPGKSPLLCRSIPDTNRIVLVEAPDPRCDERHYFWFQPCKRNTLKTTRATKYVSVDSSGGFEICAMHILPAFPRSAVLRTEALPEPKKSM